MKKNSFIILLGILSLAGVSLLLIATSLWGANLDADSVFYLLMARLFENPHLNKDMLGMFLCHFPPLFPWVLSRWHVIGVDPLQGARLMNSALFGLNILLFGILTKKYTRSAWLGLSAALLMLSAPDVVDIHLKAMSEPLFIFFMLIWLLLFMEYLKNPRWPVLILSSMIAASAVMTRFAGVPMVATGLFGILFLNQGKGIINRCIHAAVFVFTPCLCLLLYTRLSYIEDSPLQRHFAFHPVDLVFFRDLAAKFCGWFLAPQMPVSSNEKALLFGIGIACCLSRLFFRKRANFSKLSILGAAFIGLYILCFVLAASFYDAGLLLSERLKCLERYLMPVHILFLMMICKGLSDLLYKNPSSLKRDIGKIIVTYFFLFYMAGSARCLAHQYYFGDEYTTDPCRASYSIWKVKSTPMGRPIYSNKLPVIYILGGKTSSMIPVVKNPFSWVKNDKYLSQLSQMHRDIQINKGLLVYFNEAWMNEYVEPIKALQERIPLRLIAQDKYASIFDVP
ncbi:MAG: glycosyltransferase family 39 protein [Candidatus Omnitrophica bacterium]|nr:glycosyltransferase family 39 protein [Candidatus Omnitrophota bacterium]